MRQQGLAWSYHNRQLRHAGICHAAKCLRVSVISRMRAWQLMEGTRHCQVRKVPWYEKVSWAKDLVVPPEPKFAMQVHAIYPKA